MLPEEESPGRAPAEAKTLSVGLLLWVGISALVVLGLFAYFRM
ncbi:hypothetical protein [Tardiphaga sp.]|jgi:hypothetical protein